LRRVVEEGQQLPGVAPEQTPPLGHHVQLVQSLEEQGARLVDSDDNGAAAARQRLQQRHALLRRRTVETSATITIKNY